MEKKFYDNEYVLWLEFDEKMSSFLNSKCELLEQHNIAAGIRPSHLTMTFVRSDNEDQLRQTVIHFFEKVNELSLSIQSIGIFSGGVVYYEPKVTIDLLQIHKELCQSLSQVADLSWDLYVPECWVPHIALTGSLSGEEIGTAVEIMLDKFTGVRTNGVVLKLRKCFTGKEVVSMKIGK